MFEPIRIGRLFAAVAVAIAVSWGVIADKASAEDAGPPKFRLATFSIDATIPLNHRCMGVLPTKSKRIEDPLYLHGFVLLGDEQHEPQDPALYSERITITVK